jgi:hypothetical protein
VATLQRCPPRETTFNQPQITLNMKTQLNHKNAEQTAAIVERKHTPVRSGNKTFAHRYERRKIREQLRHLDWALAGVD